jgi:ribosome recycling factor
MVACTKELAEETKVAIRNIRRDATSRPIRKKEQIPDRGRLKPTRKKSKTP